MRERIKFKIIGGDGYLMILTNADNSKMVLPKGRSGSATKRSASRSASKSGAKKNVTTKQIKKPSAGQTQARVTASPGKQQLYSLSNIDGGASDRVVPKNRTPKTASHKRAPAKYRNSKAKPTQAKTAKVAKTKTIKSRVATKKAGTRKPRV